MLIGSIINQIFSGPRNIEFSSAGSNSICKYRTCYMKLKGAIIVGGSLSIVKKRIDHVLLHSDQGYDYYKVPVADGLRLVEGQVSKTCAEAGLMAVCSGDASCRYTDTAKCLVTPHQSGHCVSPM